MNLKLYFGLSLLLCLGVQNSFALETVLQYSLTEIRTPLSSADPTQKREKEIHLDSKKKVVLGDRFFSVAEGKQERIYDFKKLRIYYLDHQAKTRAEISLFADPAFRINEFQHRMSMDEVVVKAGGQALEDLFSLESIFGVESESQKMELKEDLSEKGKTQFLNQGQSVAEIEWTGKHPAPQGEMFDRFLIYDNSLHPLVRKKIVESHLIPSVIRNQIHSVEAKDQFVLVLDDLKNRPDQGFQIPQSYVFSKTRLGGGPLMRSLEKLVQSVEIGKKQVARHDKEWFLNYVQQSVEKKNYLDAVLSVVEYGLQTGDQKTTTEEMQKLAVHQKDDAELDRFLRSLGIAGPEQAKRAILELGKLNRKKLRRAHVIDIIIANQRSVLGQNEEAQKVMLKALELNPYIAGAYKDLGDMFYADFDMVSAWRCWDFARQQAPDHFMLKPISDYEADLLKKFPYFF